MNEKDSALSEEKKEAPPQECHQLFYRVMTANLEDEDEDVEDYLEPKAINEEQMKHLRSLTRFQPLRASLENFERASKNHNLEGVERSKGIMLSKVHFDNPEKYLDFIENVEDRPKCYDDLFDFLIENLNSMVINTVESFQDSSEAIDFLGKSQRDLEEILKSVRREEAKTNSLWWIKKAMGVSEDDMREKLQQLYIIRSNFVEDILNNHLKIKVERIWALREIDENIALTYASFDASTFLGLEEKDDAEVKERKFGLDDLPYLVKKDEELYENIVNYAFKSEQKVEVRKQEFKRISRKRRPTIYESLVNSITEGKDFLFSEDSLKRVKYFTEDLESAQISEEDIETLTLTFLYFHLPKRIRDKRARPSEMGLRNFFDDITIYIKKHGTMPSGEKLERFYKSI